MDDWELAEWLKNSVPEFKGFGFESYRGRINKPMIHFPKKEKRKKSGCVRIYASSIEGIVDFD